MTDWLDLAMNKVIEKPQFILTAEGVNEADKTQRRADECKGRARFSVQQDETVRRLEVELYGRPDPD